MFLLELKRGDIDYDHYFEIEGSLKYGSFVEVKVTSAGNFTHLVSREIGRIQNYPYHENIEVKSTKSRTGIGVRWEQNKMKYWRDFYLIPDNVEAVVDLIKRMSERYKIDEDNFYDEITRETSMKIPGYDPYNGKGDEPYQEPTNYIPFRPKRHTW